MATLIKKQMLTPGTYHSPDGQIVITADRLKRFATGFQSLTKSGYKVPVKWDHGDKMSDLVPVKKNSFRTAKDTVGSLKSIDVSESGAVLTMEVSDDKAAKSLEKSDVFISPVILDSFSAGGKNFKDIIGHVDIVDYPVDNKQGKAEVVGDVVKCSLVRMSNAKSFFRLADVEITDPDKDGNPEITVDVDGDEEESPETAEDTTEETETEENNEESDEAKHMKEIIAWLKAMDIIVPEDTSEDDFLKVMAAAIATAAKKDGLEKEGEVEDATEVPADSAPDDVAVASPGYMAMSNALRKAHGDNLRMRLRSLLSRGKCTPQEYKQQSAKIGVVKMSLTKSGDLKPVELETWIESRESLRDGAAVDLGESKLLARMSNAKTPVDIPLAETDDGLPPVSKQIETANRILARKYGA